MKETKNIELIESEIQRDVNKIMNIFYVLNPMLNYKHKGYRTAAQKLIKKLGLEKVRRAAEYAVAIQIRKYAPTITNPSQLLSKYGELQAYYAKNEIKKGMKIVKL